MDFILKFFYLWDIILVSIDICIIKPFTQFNDLSDHKSFLNVFDIKGETEIPIKSSNVYNE